MNSPVSRPPVADPAAEARHYRALERAWQDDVGVELLDQPYETPGSEAVFHRTFDMVAAEIAPAPPGLLIEIGCGKGHFLQYLRAHPAGRDRRLVGLDLSRAVAALPAAGLTGVQGDGEQLPFRSGSASCVVFLGSLHHLIDYLGGVAEAVRLLAPGGYLVIHEPLNSPFTSWMHRLLDPIIFRTSVQYESPIDIRYKNDFHEHRIVAALREAGLAPRVYRSDFLSYPLTGCYAGSMFGRSAGLMRAMLRLEERIERIPGLRRVALWFAWRSTIVARRPA